MIILRGHSHVQVSKQSHVDAAILSYCLIVKFWLSVDKYFFIVLRVFMNCCINLL